MFQTPSLSRIEASYRNYVSANPTSFSSSPIDDYRQDAIAAATPTRNSLVPDANAWATQPTADSLIAHVIGNQSPARPTGASGSIASGTTP